MIYNRLYQNSFVAAIFAFLLLLGIFFVFDICPSVTIGTDGKINHTVNWKYPLAISIFVFVIWYFIIYPPESVKQTIPIKEPPIQKGGLLMHMTKMP